MVRKLVLRALALVELPIRAVEHPLAWEKNEAAGTWQA
jgi:hypothetical protein